MVDEQSPISGGQSRSSLEAPSRTEVFDEEAYLRDYPDVAEAIARGDVPSGLAHYRRFGRREGRRLSPGSKEPRGVIIRTPATLDRAPDAIEMRQTVEAVVISATGGIAVFGWANDQADPIEVVRIHGDGWRYGFDGAALARTARGDVEAELRVQRAHAYGFFGFGYVGASIPRGRTCQVEVRSTSGAVAFSEIEPRLVDDLEMRNVLLLMLHTSQYLGNPQVAAIHALDRGLGDEVLKLNAAITEGLIASPHVERFGPQRVAYEASLIVCLYGKPEFLQLQCALYGALPGIDRYELVYVSNSPEIAEVLLREAKASAMIYGLSITLVLLPGNAGFGAANNVAVQAARSSRVVIVNPDVFPITANWAERHLSLVEQLPTIQTKIFGAPLFYDDGSLMHAGMYFEFDASLSFQGNAHRRLELVRVEHYAKGAPADSRDYLQTRSVPAVSGAFMSCDRGWYEKLGGFTHDYVFGHYEDADLSLKSLLAGAPVRVHDLRAWHLEGKGSTRLPVHEGGSLVNRWLFAKIWGDRLKALNLVGPHAQMPDPSAVRSGSRERVAPLAAPRTFA